MESIVFAQECHQCKKRLLNDDSGNLIGIKENEIYTCYQCYFSKEDEEQVKQDDKEMIKRGYVEMSNGRWLKPKKITKKAKTKKIEKATSDV